jgi:hypothetical protein
MMKRYIYEFHREISLVDLNKKGDDGWKLFSFHEVVPYISDTVLYKYVTLEKLLP